MPTDGAGDDEPATIADTPATLDTVPVPKDFVPEPSPLAWVAAGGKMPSALQTPSQSLTSAADAMRDEEIQRTRLFIVMGWVISVIAIGTVFFVDAQQTMTIVFVT